MSVLRRLVTVLELRAKEAVKGLAAYDKQWKAVARSVESSATLIERAADRASAAIARVADGAAAVRAGAGGLSGAPSRAGSGGGGRSGRRSAGRPARDPLDAAIAAATRQARAGNQATARAEGLAAGARPIREATAALGKHATASERARAVVADLTSQVARNRRELADLRVEALRTGDADKTLAARMQGLSAATGQAQAALGAARRELRAIDGGLIDAVKNTGRASAAFGALSSALGNMAANAASRVFHGITGSIADATSAAIKFETGLTSISKVARGADETEAGFARIKAGITETSKALGVLPTEVAELTAQLAPVFSDVSEGADGAKVDLVALTSDVTKVGVAWDISGAQAGKAFADISRGLGTTTAETKLLFGGINELGNQLGTKASDVAEALQRSAGVLKGASISGETGAALNATLIATGASAEVAATGVRTFIARLGAGEAATDKQMKAFEALGLSAKDVAKELTSGDSKRAEAQIRKVVDAIGQLDDEKRLPVLIEMFGSESIGSIGAAATATDLLGKSFAIMGDKVKAADSVQKEFTRVSNTSAAKVAALKANVEVLAIQFGEALLPHINKVVDFLTSKEGQEWGRGAVEKAVGAVTTLASVLGTVVSAFSSVADVVGGTDLAVGALALRVGALAGPWGIAAAAAVVAGATMIKVLGDVVRDAGVMDSVFSGLFDKITDKQTQAWNDKIRNKDIDDELNKPAMRAYGYGPAPAAASPPPTAAQAATVAAKDDAARFAALSARRRKGEALKPSEAAEYNRLSKSLDEAKVGKAARHKATKMDRQLAAMDPSVRGLLTRGGETDTGGDRKVAANALDRAVYDRAAKANGGTGSGGGASLGPGPNITNNWTTLNTTINMGGIDARSSASVPDNIRSAAQDGAARVGQAVITGGSSLIANRNSGGVMRSGS